MARIWKETMSPKFTNEMMGIYPGQWFNQMDRCWDSDDGYEVTSRILITEWGKVEHVAIIRVTDDIDQAFSNSGDRDIPWRIKQEIKNELFGEDRVAIEVFPEEKRKIDSVDAYHLWVFPKGYQLPFGIHPKDTRCRVVNRGCPKNAMGLAMNFENISNIRNKGIE